MVERGPSCSRAVRTPVDTSSRPVLQHARPMLNLETPPSEPHRLTPSSDYYRALVRGDMRGPWPAILRGGLRVASLPYGWAVRLRNRLYDLGWKQSYRATVPVVSV